MKAIGKQLQKGFTLVELLIVVIILAILAAIVVPQFSATTDDAKSAALDSNLAALRSAIDLYYQQHGSSYPSSIAATGGASNCNGGSAGGGAADSAEAFLSQLSLYTDAAGNTCNVKDADYPYGPYLKKAELPVNPMTNSNALVISTAGALTLVGDDTAAGWKFDNKTGRLIANDKAYDDR
jgi:general secretion pathway protein G